MTKIVCEDASEEACLEEVKQGKSLNVEGILVAQPSRAGQLVPLSANGHLSEADPYVPRELVRRFKLLPGSYLVAEAYCNENHKNPKVHYVHTADGVPLADRKQHLEFDKCLTAAPKSRLRLEHPGGPLSCRLIDLFCPIGKGQRGLIIAPPKTGKTTLLKEIAAGIHANHPECHLIALLVDERPEEVTDFRRHVPAELYASSNDEPLEHHAQVAELAIERAKRLVEVGKDVVLIFDSITRLARAYNALQSCSGRTMTGGLDIRAMEKPRGLFSCARNTQEAGSLTILASILVDTNSRMDEAIHQELKGTGNLDIVLDRRISELRIWPAINLAASGTRREELLIDEATLDKVHLLRRAIHSMRVSEAAETVISRINSTSTNAEFLRLLGANRGFDG